jgi:hypothetical protein
MDAELRGYREAPDALGPFKWEFTSAEMIGW